MPQDSPGWWQWVVLAADLQAHRYDCMGRSTVEPYVEKDEIGS